MLKYLFTNKCLFFFCLLVMSAAPSAPLKRQTSKGSALAKTAKLDESAILTTVLVALRDSEDKIQHQSNKLQSLFDNPSCKIIALEDKLAKRIEEEVAALTSKVTDSEQRISALEYKFRVK